MEDVFKVVALVLGIAVLFCGLVFGLGLLFAFPTKWLINYIFTKYVLLKVFGVEQISVWRAFAINIFAGLLFGGRSIGNSTTHKK